MTTSEYHKPTCPRNYDAKRCCCDEIVDTMVRRFRASVTRKDGSLVAPEQTIKIVIRPVMDGNEHGKPDWIGDFSLRDSAEPASNHAKELFDEPLTLQLSDGRTAEIIAHTVQCEQLVNRRFSNTVKFAGRGFPP